MAAAALSDPDRGAKPSQRTHLHDHVSGLLPEQSHKKCGLAIDLHSRGCTSQIGALCSPSTVSCAVQATPQLCSLPLWQSSLPLWQSSLPLWQSSLPLWQSSLPLWQSSLLSTKQWRGASANALE